MNRSRLIESRKALLKEIVEFFAGDERIKGVFLSGSLAEGTADEFSDIDLRVLVCRDYHKEFVSRRLEISKSWKGFLFNEWREGTQHVVSHYKPFIKVDVFYYNVQDIHPSPWFRLPINILHDPEGIVHRLIQASPEFTKDKSLDEIDQILSKALASFHEAYRRTKRGEVLFAQNLIEELRSYLVAIEDILERRVPSAGIAMKLDSRVSRELRELLLSSYVPAETDSMLLSMKRLADYLKKKVRMLHKKYSLNRQLSDDESALDIVLDELVDQKF